jgi:hypothetical protein
MLSQFFLHLKTHPNSEASACCPYVDVLGFGVQLCQLPLGVKKPSNQPKIEPSALRFESDAGVTKKAQTLNLSPLIFT